MLFLDRFGNEMTSVAEVNPEMTLPANMPSEKQIVIPRIPRQALNRRSSNHIAPGRIVCVDRDWVSSVSWEFPEETFTESKIKLAGTKHNNFAIFYAIVIGCGMFTHTQRTMFAESDAGQREQISKWAGMFPLPIGTLVQHTQPRAGQFVTADFRAFCINCDELLEVWLPDEKWPEHIEAVREKVA